MKKATTVEQQIELLTNRGMSIDNGGIKAKEILSDIGYFRLGFYCFPFETTYPSRKDRTHQYKEGAKFSDAVSLYYLDVDLRNILLKYITRIEINFRTNIIYNVSNQYINCNTWFVDHSVMEREFIEYFDAGLYTDKFRRYPVITQHHRKYINDKYAPAWKTLEFFTFGSMIYLYKNLKDKSLKQVIARRYGITNEKILLNYFNSLLEIRNICAHNGVLFDHTLYRRLQNGPAVTITAINSCQLFSVIRVILFILNAISKNRVTDMQNEITALFEKHRNNDAIYRIINDCIGYKSNHL